jgi:ankyrin repeat protein
MMVRLLCTKLQNGGHLKMVQLFITHGADINAAGSDGRGPIHIAIAHGNIDIVNLLKEHGANL